MKLKPRPKRYPRPKKKTGVELKRSGLAQVEINSGLWIGLMRAEARRIARKHGTVTADDLRPYADSIDVYPSHRNAWGAIFKPSEWDVVDRVKSTKPSNHARWIFVWELK